MTWNFRIWHETDVATKKRISFWSKSLFFEVILRKAAAPFKCQIVDEKPSAFCCSYVSEQLHSHLPLNVWVLSVPKTRIASFMAPGLFFLFCLASFVFALLLCFSAIIIAAEYFERHVRVDSATAEIEFFSFYILRPTRNNYSSSLISYLNYTWEFLILDSSLERLKIMNKRKKKVVSNIFLL